MVEVFWGGVGCLLYEVEEFDVLVVWYGSVCYYVFVYGYEDDVGLVDEVVFVMFDFL